MSNIEFRLPWDSLSKIENTIMVYFKIDKPASTEDIIAHGGPNRPDHVSRINTFLLNLKILKMVSGGRKKLALTGIGLDLAQALANGDARDAQTYWRAIVVDNDHLRKLLVQLRSKGTLEHAELVELIPDIVGEREKRTRPKDVVDGAKTIVEILGKANLIVMDYRNGRYVANVDFDKQAADTENAFVNRSRISQLRQVSSTAFDLSKHIRLCEEINECHAKGCYFAVAMLCRSVMDHVPPIFGFRDFAEVCSNYGPRSFKEVMQHLDKSFRTIANSYLHGQIRKRETLPNRTQVDFKSALDVLLAEVIRCLD